MISDGRFIEQDGKWYFVLRIDDVNNPWSNLCRRAVAFMSRELLKDGDPEKNKHGQRLVQDMRDIIVSTGGLP